MLRAVTNAELHGVQISLFNRANSVSGLQIGLINQAGTLNGLQLGLINLPKEKGARFRLFFNVNTS